MRKYCLSMTFSCFWHSQSGGIQAEDMKTNTYTHAHTHMLLFLVYTELFAGRGSYGKIVCYWKWCKRYSKNSKSLLFGRVRVKEAVDDTGVYVAFNSGVDCLLQYLSEYNHVHSSDCSYTLKSSACLWSCMVLKWSVYVAIDPFYLLNAQAQIQRHIHFTIPENNKKVWKCEVPLSGRNKDRHKTQAVQ